MGLLKILGILDITAALLLLFAAMDIVPLRIVLLHAMYLIGKGALFRGNIVSTFDIVIGVYLGACGLLAASLAPVNTLLGIYLGIKGVFSLL